MSLVQCKFCSSHLPLNSLVCTYCKQRNPISPLYQEKITISKENLKCVECEEKVMEFVELGDYQESFSALQCNDCKGIFISFTVLEKSIMHYGLKRKKIPSKIDAPKIEITKKHNLYSCPVCTYTMKRFSYKISTNVLIDQCEVHGVWLNHGELKKLIEWKQSFKNFKDKEKKEEAYRKHGLKKTKSSYTYQKNYNSSFDRFLEWLMGV